MRINDIEAEAVIPTLSDHGGKGEFIYTSSRSMSTWHLHILSENRGRRQAH